MVQAPPSRMLKRRLPGTGRLWSVIVAGAMLAAPALAADAPKIKTMILLTAPESEASSENAIDLSRIVAPAPDVLRAELTPLLGNPMTPETLQRIREVILEHYKLAGHPFLDVGFPQQDVTEGRLKVVVTEFRVGTLRTEGNNWFSDRVIESAAALHPGDTIDKPELDHRVSEFNANPFIKVTPEFEAGKTPGTTDVTLKAEDRFPVDVSVGYNNTGNPTTGWDRWNLGVNWGDALHLGQSLTYQLSTSSSFWHGLEHDFLRSEEPTVIGHTLSYSVPLRWGHTLQLSAAYQRQVPQLGPSLGSIGITDTLGAVYLIPLSETQQIGIGLDYKRSNNQLSFGGVLVQGGYTEVIEPSLHFNTSLVTSFGQTVIEDVLFLSPGGLTAANRNGAFQPAADGGHSGTPGASARYAYDKLTVTQIVPLPRDFGLVLRATGQESTTTLLGSEQLSIAGADAVRGYQEFGLAGSRGILLSMELRGPVFHPGLPLDSLQPHVFLERGDVWNPTASQSAPAYLHSESAGIGGMYTVGRNFSLRMDEGWQLIRSDRQAANGAFLHIGATATW